LIRPKRAPRKRKLTELAIRKLQPESCAYLIWDTHQHGLAIRVQPTGSRAWMCVYSYRGRPRWLHLGDARAIGLADARTLAAETMLAVARDKDPAAEKRAQRGAGTFATGDEERAEAAHRSRKFTWTFSRLLARQ
jgi:Arm DNA-binding domain